MDNGTHHTLTQEGLDKMLPKSKVHFQIYFATNTFAY